ncbi:MAG: hypothetical protein A2Y33_04720 [Spirochaetes bacterium GWF1_51_8]|nr:MAG: hypothetical protein A2Y33_04720 [Spirochaetes bacterium GWF1_51_8]
MRKALLIVFLLSISAAFFAQSKLPLDKTLLNSLVSTTLLNFDQSVKIKNFTNFHATCAKEFQKNYSPAKLKEIFEKFIQNNIDISSIRSSYPLFTSIPVIDEFGDMIVEGFYVLESSVPNLIQFTIEFRIEDSQWKPLSFKLQTFYKEKLPTTHVIIGNINKTMVSLQQAIRTTNFASFLAKSSTPLQQKLTPAKLLDIFKDFIAKKIDVSKVTNYHPIFDQMPVIDAAGDLVLRGKYFLDNPPQTIEFKLDFREEKAEWRIIYINVDVK